MASDRARELKAGLDALFEPAGVIVAGASPHPGRFGTVTLHNILRSGYQGRVFATIREGGDVLGVATVASVDELPEGCSDLVVICTPHAVNLELLRACGRKGVRAAFVAAAGYAEVGGEGAVAEAELVSVAAEEGILLAGPNGQGLVSTPASLCAQMVAPYPPPGVIAVASQSGNLTSTFMNYAIQSGVGISRAVSVGNGPVLSVLDYLEYFAADAATSVSLAYMEGVPDGRNFVGAGARRDGDEAVGGAEGWRERGGPAGGGIAYGIAGERRCGVLGGVPAGRGRAGAVGGRGVRRSGDVRDAAPAQRTERGGADHGRRLGGADGGRDLRDGHAAGTIGRRSARKS